MSTKNIWLALLLGPLILSAEGAGKNVRRTFFVQMGIEESYIIKLKPDWQFFRRRAVDLCFEDFLIKGPDNIFNLSMQFCYEDPDARQYDTPEKQHTALTELTSQLYAESHEKAQGRPLVFREFAPAGRTGFAVRMAAARWVGKTPPFDDPEGKYVTCGLFSIGDNTAIFFQLWTRAIDDALYVELLNMIVELTKPELGQPDWEVSTGGVAAQFAAREFAKRLPEEELAGQRPLVVHRRGGSWIVRGARWEGTKAVAEIEIDGATGKILRLSGCRRQED